MATRAWSTPDVVRRGEPPEEGATRDWISVGSGRLPSRETAAQVPGTPRVVRDRNSPEGSARP